MYTRDIQTRHTGIEGINNIEEFANKDNEQETVMIPANTAYTR